MVFACLAELCGRTEGLAAALGELLPRLETAQLKAPTQARSANTATAAGAASETGQQPGARSSQQGAGVAEGAGVGVGVEEVRQALRRVFLQLHRRAGRFAQVLRAAAAGEQLPGACRIRMVAYVLNMHGLQGTGCVALERPTRGPAPWSARRLPAMVLLQPHPPLLLLHRRRPPGGFPATVDQHGAAAGRSAAQAGGGPRGAGRGPRGSHT